MEEPHVWKLLNWIHDVVKPYGVELLAEIHEHYTIRKKKQKYFKYCSSNKKLF